MGENDIGKANDAATYSLAPRNVVQASDIMHVPGWGDSGIWVLTEGGEIKELGSQADVLGETPRTVTDADEPDRGRPLTPQGRTGQKGKPPNLEVGRRHE